MGMHEDTWFVYAIVCEQCGFQGPSTVNKQQDAELWAEKFGFLKLPYPHENDILYHWFCPNCRPYIEHIKDYDGRYWHHFIENKAK